MQAIDGYRGNRDNFDGQETVPTSDKQFRRAKAHSNEGRELCQAKALASQRHRNSSSCRGQARAAGHTGNVPQSKGMITCILLEKLFCLILGVEQSFSAKDGLVLGSSLRKISISYKEKFGKITLNTVNKKCRQRFFFFYLGMNTV